MRNAFMILPAAILMTGAALAKESTESVDDILKSLTDYQSSEQVELSVDNTAKPARVAKAQSARRPVAKADSTSENVESRNAKRPSEFSKAQAELAELIQTKAEKKKWALNRQALLERDYKKTEISAIDAVEAAWSIDIVMRTYALTDDASELMELSNETGPVDAAVLFSQVAFPAKTSAVYHPDSQTMFVRNTLENLAELEIMLETMGVLKSDENRDQVEIEAKFVEISEGTLEALGFQWNIEDPTSASIGGTDLELRDGAGGLFSDALRGSPTGSSRELPFGKSLSRNDAADGAWNSSKMIDTFSSSSDFIELNYSGSDSYDLLISALDQSSGADVLSAPRIVTVSGEEATIRVGELHTYPEVFEGETSSATMLVASYQDFAKKLLGVELSVMPEVMDDQIRLTLHPRITELAGWREYQLAPENSIYNYRQSTASSVYTHDPVVAQLPIFKTREIETDVTIMDGSTIAMGGLMSESIESYTDKVPVMGSLPLIGRLFRNEGERVVKQNLLMFVTAKIVDPNGKVSTSRSFE